MPLLDGWEESIYWFIKEYYQDFFDKHNFQFFKKELGGMGAIIIFSDGNILCKITNDKDYYTIDLGQIDDRCFWNLELIFTHFKFIDDGVNDLDKENRKKNLLGIDFSERYSETANYFMANFNRIKNIFSAANYNDTKEKLGKLKIERDKYYIETHFPYLK